MKGDGDSEICLVVEDDDMIETTMAGQRVKVSRFAATLRRKLYRGMQTLRSVGRTSAKASTLEHLGLIAPQNCGRREPVTSFMRAAPFPNQSELHEEADQLVADPICDTMWRLWNETAKKNTQVFTDLFRPVPTNLVRNWAGYDVRTIVYAAGKNADVSFVFQNYISKDKIGHVVEDVSLDTVKSRLSEVKGALVECPLVRDFLPSIMFAMS